MSPRCQCCYGKVKVAYCPECGGHLDRSAMEMVIQARSRRDARALTLLEDLAEALGVEVSWRPIQSLRNKAGDGRPRDPMYKYMSLKEKEAIREEYRKAGLFVPSDLQG